MSSHISSSRFLWGCRSEDVDLYKIAIPKDSDWEVMNRLGHANFLHFVDLNKHEQT
jgi:hypothetical protein